MFVFMHFHSSWLIMYNLNGWSTSPYPYFGLIQYLSYYPMFLITAYMVYIDVLTIVYLERVYPEDGYATIRFATFFNQ